MPSTFQLAKHIRLVATTAILCLCLFASASAQWELNADQSGQLEKYLDRIGAQDLLLEHLESATAAQTNLKSRRELGGRLLDLYAKRMMSGQEIEPGKWREKSELILATYPQLDTNSIRIAILQSKYREGETSFRNWWNKGRIPNQKLAQQDLWRELGTELTNLNQAMEASYEDQIAAAQSQGSNLDSAQIIQAEELLLHCHYLLGWTSYFKAILNQDDLRSNLRDSDAWFRDFLQLELNKPMTEVSETWFDFSSPWQVRALVGLAMVQRGLNYPSECKYCLDLIEKNSTDQQTRDLRYIWELNSRMYLNDYAGAGELVDSIAASNQLSKNGRIAYWNTVADSGLAIKNSAGVVSQRFLCQGLEGLAREFQAAQIADFLKRNQLELAELFTKNENSFQALWVSGILDFHHSQIDSNPKLLLSAKSKLQNAISSATESAHPLDVDKCKFLIAQIDHLHRNFDDAAEAFLEISQRFDQVDRELAAESQWLATRALTELSRRDSRRLLDTNRAIDAIIRRFPGSTYAVRGEFEKLLVNLANVPPDEAIKRLLSVTPENINFPVAMHEIVKRRYEDWLLHFDSKSEEESQKLILLFESELKFRRIDSATELSKAKSALLVIDALLRHTETEPAQIRRRLDVVKKFIQRTGSAGNLYFEYRYYEFLLANRAGESEAAKQHAIWLSENARGTRFEKSALVLLAQTADQRFRESVATDSSTPQSLEKLITIFDRLVEVLGSSPQTLASAPNARVAYARLAELKLKNGKADESATMLTTLNQLFPNNKNYLVNLGRALSAANRFEDSPAVWRRLAGGSQAGSELWFESKHGLAFGLFQTGSHDDAQALIAQTLQLSPEMPAKWKQQFDDLSIQLESITDEEN